MISPGAAKNRGTVRGMRARAPGHPTGHGTESPDRAQPGAQAPAVPDRATAHHRVAPGALAVGQSGAAKVIYGPSGCHYDAGGAWRPGPVRL